ncbi:TetR/AcrR family transcriptional regulator [Gordonia sp. zg691]|nr:TetR/AcrR family transcriptional regulator [Gordonia jinghuaiqii]
MRGSRRVSGTAEAAGSDDGAAPGRRYGGADPTERRDRRRAALITAGLDVFGTEGYAKTSVKSVCESAGLTQRYFYESFSDRADLLVAVYDDCVAFVRSATVGAVAQFLDHRLATTSAGDATAETPENATRSQTGSTDPDGPNPHEFDPEGIAPEHVPDAARAALGAFMSSLSDDPRRARVMLVEVVGVTPEIEQVRMRAIHGWAELILTLARGSRPPSHRQRLASVGLVGAVTQLLVDWYVAGEENADPAHEQPTQRETLPEILDVCVELFVAAYERLLT